MPDFRIIIQSSNPDCLEKVNIPYQILKNEKAEKTGNIYIENAFPAVITDTSNLDNSGTQDSMHSS